MTDDYILSEHLVQRKMTSTTKVDVQLLSRVQTQLNPFYFENCTNSVPFNLLSYLMPVVIYILSNFPPTCYV